MEQRRARITGWIPIRGRSPEPGAQTFVGGMTELSGSGAKLYLTCRVRTGDRLTLRLRVPADPLPVRFNGRVAWARDDETNSVESFDARLKLMQLLVHLGHPAHGIPAGFLCGFRFDPDANRTAIHRLQRYFEEEHLGAPKQVHHTLPPPDAGPVLDMGALRPDHYNH